MKEIIVKKKFVSNNIIKNTLIVLYIYVQVIHNNKGQRQRNVSRRQTVCCENYGGLSHVGTPPRPLPNLHVRYVSYLRVYLGKGCTYTHDITIIVLSRGTDRRGENRPAAATVVKVVGGVDCSAVVLLVTLLYVM